MEKKTPRFNPMISLLVRRQLYHHIINDAHNLDLDTHTNKEWTTIILEMQHFNEHYKSVFSL